MPVTNYLWDDDSDNVLMEYDENGVTLAENTHEPGEFGELISQRRNGATSYYHCDAQGSTRSLTDEAGNITDTYDYSGFGETIAKTGTTTNPYRYVGAFGYYFDEETEDYYVRERPYKPIVGRWMSRNPLGVGNGDAKIVQTDEYIVYTHEYVIKRMRDRLVDISASNENVNLFAYVSNNPVNAIDPSGLQTWLDRILPREGVICSNLGAVFHGSDCASYFCGSDCRHHFGIPAFRLYRICPACGITTCIFTCEEFRQALNNPPIPDCHIV